MKDSGSESVSEILVPTPHPCLEDHFWYCPSISVRGLEPVCFFRFDHDYCILSGIGNLTRLPWFEPFTMHWTFLRVSSVDLVLPREFWVSALKKAVSPQFISPYSLLAVGINYCSCLRLLLYSCFPFLVSFPFVLSPLFPSYVFIFFLRVFFMSLHFLTYPLALYCRSVFDLTQYQFPCAVSFYLWCLKVSSLKRGESASCVPLHSVDGGIDWFITGLVSSSSRLSHLLGYYLIMYIYKSYTKLVLTFENDCHRSSGYVNDNC